MGKNDNYFYGDYGDDDKSKSGVTTSKSLRLYEWEGTSSTFNDWLIETLAVRKIPVEKFVKAIGEPFTEDDFWKLTMESESVANSYAPDKHLVNRIIEALEITSKREQKTLIDTCSSLRNVTKKHIAFPEKNITNSTDALTTQQTNKSLESDIAYYEKLFAARDAFYDFLNTETGGKINSPEKLSEEIGLKIEVCKGMRQIQRNELNTIDKFDGIGIDPEKLEEGANHIWRFLETVRKPLGIEKGTYSTDTLCNKILVGRKGVVAEKLHFFYDSMIKEKTDEEISEAKATAIVNREILGMRRSLNGQDALFVTEAGLIKLGEASIIKSRCDKAKPVEEGMFSARLLAQKFRGTYETIDKELRELGEKLIKNKMAGSVLAEDASIKIDEEYGGMRTAKNEIEAFFVTEKGVELWVKEYNRKTNDEIAPIAGEDMLSAEYLSRKLKYVGEPTDFTKEFKELGAQIKKMIKDNGALENDANTTIDNEYGGIRASSKSGGGQETFFVTKKGAELWKAVYNRSSKLDNDPLTKGSESVVKFAPWLEEKKLDIKSIKSLASNSKTSTSPSELLIKKCLKYFRISTRYSLGKQLSRSSDFLDLVQQYAEEQISSVFDKELKSVESATKKLESVEATTEEQKKSLWTDRTGDAENSPSSHMQL